MFDCTRETLASIEKEGGKTLDGFIRVFQDICTDAPSEQNSKKRLQFLPISNVSDIRIRLCDHINLLLSIAENHQELYEEELYQEILPDFIDELREMEEQLKSPVKKEIDFEDQLIANEELIHAGYDQMAKLQEQIEEYKKERLGIVLNMLQEE